MVFFVIVNVAFMNIWPTKCESSKFCEETTHLRENRRGDLNFWYLGRESKRVLNSAKLHSKYVMPFLKTWPPFVTPFYENEAQRIYERLQVGQSGCTLLTLPFVVVKTKVPSQYSLLTLIQEPRAPTHNFMSTESC